MRKFVSHNRQFEEECTACGGEGYVGQQKAGIQPAEVEDPIKTQARLLGTVRHKLNDDPDEFAIFMQFTMEFGKRAIAADEYVFFLIDKLGAVSCSCATTMLDATDALSCAQDCVKDLAPSLASLIKKIDQRTAFIDATKRCLLHTVKHEKLVAEKAAEQGEQAGNEEALVLLQRLMRGRAAQNEMFSGMSERLDEVRKLREQHGKLKVGSGAGEGGGAGARSIFRVAGETQTGPGAQTQAQPERGSGSSSGSGAAASATGATAAVALAAELDHLDAVD